MQLCKKVLLTFLLSFGLTYYISAMDKTFRFGEVGNGSEVEQPRTPDRVIKRNTHSSPAGGVKKPGQKNSPKGKGVQLDSPNRRQDRLSHNGIRPRSAYIPSSSDAPRRRMDQHFQMNSLLNTSPLKSSNMLPFSVELAPQVLYAPNLGAESSKKVTTEEVSLLRRVTKVPLFLRNDLDDLSDSGIVASESSKSSVKSRFSGDSRSSEDLLQKETGDLFGNGLETQALRRGAQKDNSKIVLQHALYDFKEEHSVIRVPRLSLLSEISSSEQGVSQGRRKKIRSLLEQQQDLFRQQQDLLAQQIADFAGLANDDEEEVEEDASQEFQKDWAPIYFDIEDAKDWRYRDQSYGHSSFGSQSVIKRSGPVMGYAYKTGEIYGSQCGNNGKVIGKIHRKGKQLVCHMTYSHRMSLYPDDGKDRDDHYNRYSQDIKNGRYLATWDPIYDNGCWMAKYEPSEEPVPKGAVSVPYTPRASRKKADK